MPPRSRSSSTTRRQAPRPRPKPKGVFARLKSQAEKDRPPVEPYVIDDVDPPIVIQPPDDAESQLAAADLFTEDGRFEMKDARRVLHLICGDAFDRVWELVRKEHISVLLALINDIGLHFQAQAGPQVTEEDFPGGSPASSA